MQMPWRSFRVPGPGREYLALFAYLPLKRFRALPRFLWYVLQVRKQLSKARGLIGYTMEMRLWSLQFWTLSVWEDEEMLQQFVGRLPHAAIMQALASHMASTNFLRWRVFSSELPMTLEMAHNREQPTTTS
jgi:hypothetical protein